MLTNIFRIIFNIQQRERETNPQLESSGSGQYSVLNQNVIITHIPTLYISILYTIIIISIYIIHSFLCIQGKRKTGAGVIIYADLGAPPKNRPIVPPPSGFSEPVVYSSITTNPPPVPKRVSIQRVMNYIMLIHSLQLSQKKKDMIYAQLQLELPPSVTPPPPPSVNIQQEKVIYSSVNKQL